MQENATFALSSQFGPDQSEFMCVAFSVAGIKLAGPPNGRPRGTKDQHSSLGKEIYKHFDDAAIPGNDMGMTLPEETEALKWQQLQFRQLPISENTEQNDDLRHVREALTRGSLLTVCAREKTFIDTATEHSPYSWFVPDYWNHCVIVSGIAGNNLIVRDTAAPTTEARVYDSRPLFMISAVEIIPDWITLSDEEKETMKRGVPNKWRDDPHKGELTAPNGVKVVGGFRDRVLAGWNPNDLPLAPRKDVNKVEPADPSRGNGSIQYFMFSILGKDKQGNIYSIPAGRQAFTFQK